MEIIFRTTINSNPLVEEPFENYSAEIILHDVVDVTTVLSSSSDETSYAEFKANVYRDLLEALTDAADDELLIFEEEPYCKSYNFTSSDESLFNFEIDSKNADDGEDS